MEIERIPLLNVDERIVDGLMAHTNEAFWKFQVWDRVAWLFPLVDSENIFSSFKRKLNCHGFN